MNRYKAGAGTRAGAGASNWKELGFGAGVSFLL